MVARLPHHAVMPVLRPSEAGRAPHPAGPKLLDTRIGPRFTSSDVVLCCAGHGLGVALAKHRLDGNAIRSGTLLQPFGDARVALPNAYWVVLSDSAAMRETVNTVVGWLKEEAS